MLLFKKIANFTGKLLQKIVGMRNFQDTFKTRKPSFSICIPVPLSE